MSQFILANGVWVIDLVSEDQEWNFGEVFHGEKGVELGFGFRETFMVFGVDQENYAGDFGEVIFPQTAGLLMATQVKSCESVVANCQFLRCRMQGWLKYSDSVVLQHVKKCSLSSIVKSKEQQFRMLVEQTKGGQDIVEPVDNPHREGSRGAVDLVMGWIAM